MLYHTVIASPKILRGYVELAHTQAHTLLQLLGRNIRTPMQYQRNGQSATQRSNTIKIQIRGLHVGTVRIAHSHRQRSATRAFHKFHSLLYVGVMIAVDDVIQIGSRAHMTQFGLYVYAKHRCCFHNRCCQRHIFLIRQR